MWKRSITLRLTLFFATVSTAVLLGFGYLVVRAVEAHFEEQDLMLLKPKLDLAVEVASNLQSPEQFALLPEQLHIALVHEDMAVMIATPDGRRLAGTADYPFPQALLRSGEPGKLVKWREEGRSFRGIAARTSTRIAAAPEVAVGFALDIGIHEKFMEQFRRELWIAVALGILIAAFLGWVAASRGLAPARAMAALARGITASSLKDRLFSDAVPIELADLADAFNGMLARLEESFRRLSEFSSDIAHELRTPVANLTTQVQVVLSRARSAEEYREVLYSNLELLDRMARMISDMLYLAKADNGLIMPSSEILDLASEAAELLDFYGALAEEKAVQLRFDGAGKARGDRLMIRRALSNLLSNAIRHAGRDGKVNVIVQPSAIGEATIEVKNTGLDIAPEHIGRLFQRFYRVERPGEPSGGTGLGLAITKAIVEAHGGSISATFGGGITSFVIVLPAA